MRLGVNNLGRTFGSLVALEGVSIEFNEGEIHAVIGENGAGKSTLMNVLGGHLQPTSGSVTIDGEPVTIASPQNAQKFGIEMVHQHFKLIRNFSVTENLALAASARSEAFPGTKELAAPALARGASLGWQFEPDALVSNMTVGEQQRLEITKCLVDSCRILILDEPTAVLSPREVEDLFEVLSGLREQGVAIILIAHKLREILEIADQVSVLRQGRLVHSSRRADATLESLSSAMLGSSVNLDPENLRTVEAAIELDPNPRPGEVLGIGGVDGNGQKEFAESLVRSVEHSAFIPQDRQTEGLALSMSIADNLLIGPVSRGEYRRWLPFGKVQDWAKSVIHRFRIKASSPNALAGSLSGGNQQKVVLARALEGEPSTIVAINPTRGLDFQSAAFVHTELRNAASRGAAVLLVSSDREELDQVADRILYMVRGELKTTMEEAVQ